MPRITICPRCTSHLGLPGDVSPAAQVQCPICEVEFSLATVQPRELPQARLLDDVEMADPASAPDELSPQQRLSELIRSTAVRPMEHDEEETVLTETYDDAYQDADPELAHAPRPDASHDEMQLGSSRLDQLLSDLIKTPASPSRTAPAPELATSSFAEQHALESNSPPANNFDAELDDEAGPPKYAEFAPAAEEEEIATVGERQELSEDSGDVVPALGDQPGGQELPSDLRTAPRRKRRRPGVRTLVGVAGGGVLGLLLGAYILLWLGGAERDFLGLARYLPTALLPASEAQYADSAPRGDVASPALPEDAEASSEQGSSPAAAGRGAMRYDSAVSAATAEEPAAAPGNDNSLGRVLPQVPTTPPTVVQPAAERHAWPTTSIVGDVRGVKLYSVDQLAELIPAADAAHREFLAGDLSREESWSTMGPAYMTIASLAERYTLVDPAMRGPELVTNQLAAKNIFRGLLGNPARRNDVATVAARWLQHERRLNPGVVLVGRVIDLSPQGKWTRYTINVPLADSFVTAHVLTDQIQHSAGDEIAVVGAILANPAEQLEGYEGIATQLVVAGFCFKPEEFEAPRADAAAARFPFEGTSGGE